MKTNQKYKIQSRGTLQPREKAMNYGISVLNDKELLKILIGSGQKNCSVDKIAGDLLNLLDKEKELPDLETLMSVKGMGMARSSLIAAALEFSRRHYLSTGQKVSQPGDAYPLLAHMADRKQEYFFTISLNGAHEHIKTRQVSQGLLNRTIVHPREVYADPIHDRAAALIVAHNHPSGNLEPSREDRDITRRLQDAGEILGIPILDHLIFCPSGYFSFLEQGLL
ncbi:DNA repair protein RadC [Oceanispirochaeta sp.]|jgi:DNA repair protein RadC|uniref:RadC family protein n=1 Tax=Oceanispirochaeta sp. TaxID=2035350 RepID=UPI00260E6736|nr:DNA repair protein RadC [Oceanispirochaeta sp.]MDA3955661.1 DNA repair protein RadC [Oceanispirochaeta sp.]